MDFDNETLKIIGYVVAGIAAISGGALFAIKKSKSKKISSKQSNVTMTGDGNKIIGGDDNSTNTSTK